MSKVVLASDIDKTLTDERGLVPDEVVNYLEGLHHDGWQIVLVTGRTFSYAMMSLEKLDFPFYLAVQNGAEILEMPSKKILYQTFLSKSVAYYVDGFYREQPEDFLIYSGLEKGDFCYYRTNKFSPYFLNYLEKLKRVATGEWVHIDEMADVAQDAFPLIKCLGDRAHLETVQRQLSHIQLATSSLILDSVAPSLPLLLVTHHEVDKGQAFRKLQKQFGWSGPVVAAGDDRNDIPLFKVADIKIVMSNAPDEVRAFGDIVAKTSFERGIIPALDEVKKRL